MSGSKQDMFPKKRGDAAVDGAIPFAYYPIFYYKIMVSVLVRMLLSSFNEPGKPFFCRVFSERDNISSSFSCHRIG
jgi:hypothetical protein